MLTDMRGMVLTARAAVLLHLLEVIGSEVRLHCIKVSSSGLDAFL